MPVFYTDSSSLFKRYRTESGTDVMNAVFDEKNGTDRLVTSHLAAVEIESAGSRGLKGGVLNRRGYGIIVRLFAEDLGTMIGPPRIGSRNKRGGAGRQATCLEIPGCYSPGQRSQNQPGRAGFVCVRGFRQGVGPRCRECGRRCDQSRRAGGSAEVEKAQGPVAATPPPPVEKS